MRRILPLTTFPQLCRLNTWLKFELMSHFNTVHMLILPHQRNLFFFWVTLFFFLATLVAMASSVTDEFLLVLPAKDWVWKIGTPVDNSRMSSVHLELALETLPAKLEPPRPKSLYITTGVDYGMQMPNNLIFSLILHFVVHLGIFPCKSPWQGESSSLRSSQNLSLHFSQHMDQ